MIANGTRLDSYWTAWARANRQIRRGATAMKVLLGLALVWTTFVDIGCVDASRQGGVRFRGADGRTLTLNELQGVNGQVQWEVVGGANVPSEARTLHESARQAG